MIPPFTRHCAACGTPMPCGCRPAQATPVAPAPQASPAGVVTRYGIDYCQACTFPLDYCGCGRTPADAASEDGAESGLNARIRERAGAR